MNSVQRELLSKLRCAGFTPVAYPARGNPAECCVAVRAGDDGALRRLRGGRRRRVGRNVVIVFWPAVPAPRRLRFNDFEHLLGYEKETK